MQRQELILVAKSLPAYAYGRKPTNRPAPPWIAKPLDRYLSGMAAEHQLQHRQDAAMGIWTLSRDLMECLTVGQSFTLGHGKVLVTGVDGKFVIQPSEGGQWFDPVIIELLKVFGDRFAVCPNCGHGFFRFAKAQYCSRPCSNTGRRKAYRARKSAEKPPRLRSKLGSDSMSPRRQAQHDQVIEEARKYLETQTYWQKLHGAEAEEAIADALADMSRAMMRSPKWVPKFPKAYALQCLRNGQRWKWWRIRKENIKTQNALRLMEQKGERWHTV